MINDLCFLPHFSLTNLTSLELRENLIGSIPNSFARLTKLERLDLGDNEIEELVIIHFIYFLKYMLILKLLFQTFFSPLISVAYPL